MSSQEEFQKRFIQLKQEGDLSGLLTKSTDMVWFQMLAENITKMSAIIGDVENFTDLQPYIHNQVSILLAWAKYRKGGSANAENQEGQFPGIPGIPGGGG